jgi:hypothetical protein
MMTSSMNAWKGHDKSQCKEKLAALGLTDMSYIRRIRRGASTHPVKGASQQLNK